MKSGQADRRIWIAATWLAVLAGCAWGVELPWTWEGRMEFGGERSEWVVDLDGAPERIEVCLEGGGGRFLVDEASWDGVWNGTPLGEFREGTGGGWQETRLAPDEVTRHLRFRPAEEGWTLTGVRVAGDDGKVRVAFDREDGFEVEPGAEGVCIHARVEHGGGGWFGTDAWTSDGAGHGDGERFWLDTSVPGGHWAHVRGGCDGSDEEAEGTIRWWVGARPPEAPLPEYSPVASDWASGRDAGPSLDLPAPRAVRATPEEYYAGCYGADGHLLSGADLKAALCSIVNEGTRTNGYGSNLNSILRTTDACPTNPGLVQCIYLQHGIQDFNKEHLWPQSHGIDGLVPAYSDLHHLRASESSMNSTRGNLDFDLCEGLAEAKEKNGCWYTKSAFEPPDSAKGDVARAVMYMAVRYEAKANSNGDLELVERVGTGPGTNVLGRLSTLLDWNELDPVDAFETNRNELIYQRYQGNRNPFIDHPEWARRVFAPESWSTKPGAAPVVPYLDARQRYPWNGLVDIDYELAIQGGRGGEEVWVDVVGFDGETGKSVGMWTLEGAGASGPVPAGRYRLTWDMGADAPDLVSRDFSVQLFAGARPATYWVVDMGGGPDAERWTVETWEGEPAGGWTTDHKTTKLVLRRIGAETFAMGSREEEAGRRDDELLHAVALDRSYGLGVFEVTQRQWELATGTNPSTHVGDTRPVDSVDYDAIRGTDSVPGWPGSDAVDASSFLGILRAKTGLAFDLPTEAQWEHACRAGSGTALNDGRDLSGLDECGNLDELGRYTGNPDDGRGGFAEHTAVGSYSPNAWGLHDMHGNVAEWCLDWYGPYAGTDVTNPPGPAFGTLRVQRGGDWRSPARDCRSASRGQAAAGTCSDAAGFRVACGMQGSKAQRLAFDAVGPMSVTGHVELAATASSGEAVSFTVVSGPGVLDGHVLSFTATGAVVVCASQAGDGNWWPVSAEQTLEVYRAAQRLDFPAIGSRTVAERVELQATATGGGPVEFAVVSGPGVVDGRELSFTEPGTVVVSATQAGNGYWAPVSATQTVRVYDEGVLFHVTVDPDIAHGSVIPDISAAIEGEIVTLDVVPDDGWKRSVLTVNGEPLRGTSFAMPAGDVVVSAVFVERVAATYALVEYEDEFEMGGEYIFVARTPGVFTSAMRNGITASRIGVEEVEIGPEDTITTDSDSIVWKIQPGAEEGQVTIYNAEANVHAAAPSSAENHAQLLANGNDIRAQWTLELSSLPDAQFHSVRYPDRWLSRNLELGNAYFAAYRSYGRLPRLYKKGGNVFKVSLDQPDGFTVWHGSGAAITARAKYGSPPYTYTWTGDFSGEGPVLEIPDTLDEGTYSVMVAATGADGRSVTRSVGFQVRVPEAQYLTITGPYTVTSGVSVAYTCVATYSDGSRPTVVPEWTLEGGDGTVTISPDGVLLAEGVLIAQSVVLHAAFDGLSTDKTIYLVPNPDDEGRILASWPLVNTLAGTTEYSEVLSIGDIEAKNATDMSLSSKGFLSRGWSCQQPDENAYCEFSVSVAPGASFELDALKLNLRSSLTGPGNAEVRWSLDDGTGMGATALSIPLDGNTYGHHYSVNLGGISLAGGQALTFRIHPWGATSETGTFRLGNGSPMVLAGRIVDVPSTPDTDGTSSQSMSMNAAGTRGNSQPRHSSSELFPTEAPASALSPWMGQTPPFRVDARAASGETLEAAEPEWVVWDTAWSEEAHRVEVTLERPGGEMETLGSAEGSKAHGSAEWTPGENEWGTFTLRLASWDADGEPLDELLALRIRRSPAVLTYEAWIAARGGTPETMPMEADADADGASNWEEYVADTDPLNPEETFASRLEVLDDGTLRVIPSVVSTGRIYRVRLHGDLFQDAVWQDLGPGRTGIGAELGGETGQTGFGAVGVSLP